jgi:hypothetical protein
VGHKNLLGLHFSGCGVIRERYMGHIADASAKADGYPHPIGQPAFHHIGVVKGDDSAFLLTVHIDNATAEASVEGDAVQIFADRSVAAHEQICQQEAGGHNSTEETQKDGKEIDTAIFDLRPGRDKVAVLMDDDLFGGLPQT